MLFGGATQATPDSQFPFGLPDLGHNKEQGTPKREGLLHVPQGCFQLKV